MSFLSKKKARFPKVFLLPTTGQNSSLFCPASLPFSHLSSCQREKQNTQGPPISSMVVRPSSQDLWGYRIERYLSLTSVGYPLAQYLPTCFGLFLTHVLKSATNSIGSSSLGQVSGQTKVCQFQMTYIKDNATAPLCSIPHQPWLIPRLEVTHIPGLGEKKDLPRLSRRIFSI